MPTQSIKETSESLLTSQNIEKLRNYKHFENYCFLQTV